MYPSKASIMSGKQVSYWPRKYQTELRARCSHLNGISFAIKAKRKQNETTNKAYARRYEGDREGRLKASEVGIQRYAKPNPQTPPRDGRRLHLNVDDSLQARVCIFLTSLTFRDASSPQNGLEHSSVDLIPGVSVPSQLAAM